MHYYIENHDMEIILEGLECLHEYLKKFGHHENLPFSAEEVEGLFESLEKVGESE